MASTGNTPAAEPKPSPLPASTEMDRVRQLAARVAGSPISVLILGETGVGKEVLAETIHHLSPRRSKPFVCINCVGLPEPLFESELFGYEKGAFTGADRAKLGILEAAHEGTVLLDEVGEMPLALQAKLLRVLEQREVQPVGSLRPRPIDVRILAATNRDLEDDVLRGTFRRDLFFRLAGVTLQVPPLRERRTEIPPLAQRFLEEAARASGRRTPVLAPRALDLLLGYLWPGNIRELKNVIERALVLAEGDIIDVPHLPADKLSPSAPPLRVHTTDPRATPPRGTVPGGGMDPRATPTRGTLPGGGMDPRGTPPRGTLPGGGMDPRAAPPRGTLPGGGMDPRATPARAALPSDGDPPSGDLRPAPSAFAGRASSRVATPPSGSQEGSFALAASEPPGALPPEKEAERLRILEALAACAGNQSRAAALLNMPRRTFVAKLDTYRIARPRKPVDDEQG